MHNTDMVTYVMPVLKSIHMLDLDLDHFMPKELRHDFTWLYADLWLLCPPPHILWKTRSWTFHRFVFLW